MSEIIVTSQKEWNEISGDFKDYVYIQAPGNSRIVIAERKGFRVIARGNSSVEARGNSSVEARENSSVEAWENSSVEAWGNSSVEAWGNSSVEAWENSSVEAWENSSVEAWENSSVVAWGNSSVVAWGNSSVEAWGNSSVEAWGNSSVEARENSSVEARENSSVVAWGNSSVEARENSSVVAWGNSSVEARGNVQIAQYSDKANLQIQGNARIVRLPQTAEEYCDFYGVTVKDGVAILYKAVRENLCSYHDCDFKYVIGETATNECDQDIDDQCSWGLHVSHLHWAIGFGSGRNNPKIIECAVLLDKIVVPKNTDGKVRTSELLVLREVPMEEWGVYGKIMARKKGNLIT